VTKKANKSAKQNEKSVNIAKGYNIYFTRRNGMAY